MARYTTSRTTDGTVVENISHRGRALLSNPIYNRGTGFTLEERKDLRLTGLLPFAHSELDTQVQRAYRAIEMKETDLEKYIGLASLQDRNETLFYALLKEHIEEYLAIVYTPTVGEACQRFSHILRRTRGFWITPENKGEIESVLQSSPFEDVRLIVVTDNERILGLGDQGAGGIGIPVGKLALYSVCAGIHPSKTLPISLDVGTDNEALLNDPLYVGWRHKRLRGAEYDALVEEFVVAVKKVFPNVCLQWEDFKKQNAIDLMDRYKDRLLSFNDDIEGTAAVAVAGVIAAQRAANIEPKDQRVLILGAGAAGVGIARLLQNHFKREGVPADEVGRSVAVLDSKGLLIEGREYRDKYKEEFAWKKEWAKSFGMDTSGPLNLLSVVKAFKPNVLIGTSGQKGTFTKEVIIEMASHCDKPAVFPFSNPTSKTEALPEDIIAWTEGRALVATGSPFEPVHYGDREIPIPQGNNVYIFPGVGLGALVVKARKITESMFAVAARTLAESLDAETLAKGSLFPPLTRLRPIARSIAKAVAMEAIASGVADAMDDDSLEKNLDEAIWEPKYLPVHAV